MGYSRDSLNVDPTYNTQGKIEPWTIIHNAEWYNENTLPQTVIINNESYVPQHRHNISHTSKCSIDVFDNELNTYNPYNDRYSYEDEVEYNDGVQKIISKLVKIDTED